MPNPIQQVPSGLEGLFGALEALGTAYAMKGREEEQRMVAIQNDPEQAAQMATLIRQAAASGRTNEEIAAGLGFHGEKGVPFINTIAATYPQGSAERLEEAAVGADISGLSVEELMGTLGQSIATTTAQAEQGAAAQAVTTQVASDRLTEAQANQQLDFTQRLVAAGGTELQANIAMRSLEEQGLALDTSIDAWERYNSTVEAWRNSGDPTLQHFAETASLGLKNPASLSHIAQHEDRDFRASLQSATAGNMDFMDMLTVVDKINGWQQDISERREAAMLLRGADRERALEELRVESAGVANLEMIAAGMHPVLGASLTGGPMIRRDSRGRPVPGQSEIISGPARRVRDGLRQGFMVDDEGTRHGFSIEDAEAQLVVLEGNPNTLPGTLEDVRWEIEQEKTRRKLAAGNPILAQFGAGVQAAAGGISAIGPAMLQAAMQIELTRELIAPEFEEEITPSAETTSELEVIPPGSGGPPPVKIRPDPDTLVSVPGGMNPVNTLFNDELDHLYEQGSISTADYVREITRRGR
jgi:hypothetical protein